MGTANRRLPRVPHAPKLDPAETVLSKGTADLQNGWLSRHGDLVITDERIVFQPTVLDTLLRAKRREIPLDQVTEIERFPLSPGGMPTGGRRPRVLLHTEQCTYELMMGDVDGWIDTLQRVYQRRERRGNTYVPPVTREGYTNVLLED